MKFILILIFSILSSSYSFAQNRKTDQILAEGKLLYKLEKASWHSSDDYLFRFPFQRDSVGGYISYSGVDNKINTIFFNRFNPDQVLVHYYYGENPEVKPLKINDQKRKATKNEEDLIALYMDARKNLMENSDSFFNFYPDTSFNIIPLIQDRKKQVFLITATEVSGMLILGNDYILDYNNRNNLRNKSKIHNSILHFPATSSEDEKMIQTTYHSHVVTEYISSTDICTLLLYRDHVEWKKHIVVSENQVSIFDMELETLNTMKTKDWEKLNEENKVH